MTKPWQQAWRKQNRSWRGDLKAGEDSLSEWRKRATDLVALANAIVNLPVLIPVLAGYGPQNAGPTRLIGLVSYAAAVAAAVLRSVDQRVRAWLILCGLYAVACTGAAALPQGPYVRALPVFPPLLAIGLLGVAHARLFTVLSAVILILAPFLREDPGLIHWVITPNGWTQVPLSQAWWPGAALLADLLVLMVLLERFYGFLLQSLAAHQQAAADRVAANTRLQREVEERQRLELEIARVGDEERRHLGHEIHDGVCQQLTGALLRCQALELRVKKGQSLPSEDLRALSLLLGETIHEARAVAQGLCPFEPVPDALAPALRSLVKRTLGSSGIACEFHSEGDVLVPNPAAAQHLYRITQEALSNAVRHAAATRICVELRGEKESLLLRVEDDGVGLPESVPPGGMGLRTMSFRARVIGGEFGTERPPAGGTRISCRVPRTGLN